MAIVIFCLCFCLVLTIAALVVYVVTTVAALDYKRLYPTSLYNIPTKTTLQSPNHITPHHTTTVQAIFNLHKDAPLIASNLPPIAGSLTWCKSLRDRIYGPMEKLKTLDKKIVEREDTREVVKIYTSLMGQLGDLGTELGLKPRRIVL
jgi:hypothetical protein